MVFFSYLICCICGTIVNTTDHYDCCPVCGNDSKNTSYSVNYCLHHCPRYKQEACKVRDKKEVEQYYNLDIDLQHLKKTIPKFIGVVDVLLSTVPLEGRYLTKREWRALRKLKIMVPLHSKIEREVGEHFGKIYSKGKLLASVSTNIEKHLDGKIK